MKDMLYIIDCTSRQYPFSLEDGLVLTIHDEQYPVTVDNPNLERFYAALINHKPFVLEGVSGAVAFNSDNIVGIQLIKAPKEVPELGLLESN